jgi:hypothetical protein
MKANGQNARVVYGDISASDKHTTLKRTVGGQASISDEKCTGDPGFWLTTRVDDQPTGVVAALWLCCDYRIFGNLLFGLCSREDQVLSAYIVQFQRSHGS